MRNGALVWAAGFVMSDPGRLEDLVPSLFRESRRARLTLVVKVLLWTSAGKLPWLTQCDVL